MGRSFRALVLGLLLAGPLPGVATSAACRENDRERAEVLLIGPGKVADAPRAFDASGDLAAARTGIIDTGADATLAQFPCLDSTEPPVVLP